MIKSIEVKGKNRDEAEASALAQLGKNRDEVAIEVIEEGKTGFFGIGAVPALIRVSYEIPDSPQIKAERFLNGLMEKMGVDASISSTFREDGGLNISINGNGNGMGVVIGRRGETLDAIQHLTSYSVNRGCSERTHISVDAESYRAKREESLVRLAEKMAAKAVKYRRSMALEPMNSYERHVIHSALQDYPEVSTSSIGVEPNRRVVVNYERPEMGKSASREWA